MKIEKLSENQIRCTLNKSDLADKEVKLSELAYGSPKARELFKEMMQQASNELGFEAHDVPLMVEAIPVSPDCLILIITKVEDPEELDTRFSRFSKTSEYDIDTDEDEDEDFYEDEDMPDDDISSSNTTEISIDMNTPPANILEAIEGLVNSLAGLSASSTGSTSEPVPDTVISESKKTDIFRIYTFDSLESVIKASKLIASIYMSSNTLYKDPVSGIYYLVITKSDNSSNEFFRVCSILSEYGTRLKATYAMPYHFNEHFTIILENEAVQTLSAL